MNDKKRERRKLAQQEAQRRAEAKRVSIPLSPKLRGMLQDAWVLIESDPQPEVTDLAHVDELLLGTQQALAWVFTDGTYLFRYTDRRCCRFPLSETELWKLCQGHQHELWVTYE